MPIEVTKILTNPAVYGWAAVIAPPAYFVIKIILRKFRNKRIEKSNAKIQADQLTKDLFDYFKEQSVDVDFWGQKNVDKQANQLETFLNENHKIYGGLGDCFATLYSEYNEELINAPLRKRAEDDFGIFSEDEEEYSIYPEYEDEKVKTKATEIIVLLNKIKTT